MDCVGDAARARRCFWSCISLYILRLILSARPHYLHAILQWRLDSAISSSAVRPRTLRSPRDCGPAEMHFTRSVVPWPVR